MVAKCLIGDWLKKSQFVAWLQQMVGESPEILGFLTVPIAESRGIVAVQKSVSSNRHKSVALAQRNTPRAGGYWLWCNCIR
ncbi:MAG: hypothetical protein ACXIT4_00875 [Erythrobacter sp.]